MHLHGAALPFVPLAALAMGVELIPLSLQAAQVVTLVFDQELELLNLALVVGAQPSSYRAAHGGELPVLSLRFTRTGFGGWVATHTHATPALAAMQHQRGTACHRAELL